MEHHKKSNRPSMMTIVCIVIAFILLLGLHSVKSIYVINYLLFWVYVALIIATIFGSIYFFKRYSFGGCISVVLISSLIVGLMPYQDELPRMFNLLSQSDAEVSAFSKAFSRPIGVTVDILFYILPTALVFFLLALGVRHFGSSGS